MHPGTKICLGQVPTLRELEGKEHEVQRYIRDMKRGIKLGDDTLNFNFSSNSRTHGIGVFTGTDIASMYFGPNNPMSYVNYGSVLLTSCRKMITLELKVLIVDDEIPEVRKTGLGDSHGKCSPEILRILSSNVEGQEEGGEINTPLQVRMGFPGKFIFKGTIMGFNRGVIPPGIVNRYKNKGEGTEWDLILTLSGIKGNKPADGTNLRNETVYAGNVHYAETREAKASQQLWMWFTKKAILKDVIPGIEREGERISNALKDRKLLPGVLKDLDRIADLEVSGQIDTESGEPYSDVSDEAGKRWVSPVVEILDADKEGVLLEHPYINSKIRQLLGRTWLRLALNSDKRFKSVMMQPDDSIPKGNFVCGSIPKGWHIVFRNPILSFGSIILAYNKKDGTYPYYEKQRGVAVMSHETASNSQGDFDGDFITVIPLDKEQQAYVEELIEADEDPTFGDIMFDKYIKGELKLPGDKFFHIIFEVFNFNRLWGLSPIIKKPDKVKSNESAEKIFYISMDNPTGLISSTIQAATSNGTIRKVQKFKVHDIYTNTYTGETYEASILQFLAQQMQISVDRLKSTIYNDMEGIKEVRKFVLGYGIPAWFGKDSPGEKNYYKDKRSYVTRPIPVGTLHGDGKITGKVNEFDVVSSMIRIVNGYWSEWAKSAHHVSEYRNLFPDNIFDEDMRNRAKKIHLDYAEGIIKAISIGKTDETDKDGGDFVEARKKAVLEVMESINDTRIEQENAEINIDKEVEMNGESIIEELVGGEFYNKALADRLIPTNSTSIHPLDGIWEEPNGDVNIARPFNYAAAMWSVCHSRSAMKESTGSTVFFLHIPEIIEQLGKLEKRMNKARYFGSNKPFPGSNISLGDFIFASPDCTPKSKSTSPVRPRQCVKREGDPSIFMPSRMDGNKLADVNSNSGVIIPNSVQIQVKEEGVNNDRARSKKYTIYMRTSPTKPWTPLGFIGAGEPVPELGKVHDAKIYSQNLTQSPEKLLSNHLTNEEARLRCKGGIITWKSFR